MGPSRLLLKESTARFYTAFPSSVNSDTYLKLIIDLILN